MSVRNSGERPILDANDAVTWAVRGTLTFAVIFIVIGLSDSQGWSFWMTLPVALAGGALIAVVTWQVDRWRRRRAASKPNI